MKKLAEGRLPAFINSDGELEEDTETHAERVARTIATAQKVLIWLLNFVLSFVKMLNFHSCFLKKLS